MSPTASSKAKMFRSVSVGDGIHLPDPPEDPLVTPHVKETPPTPGAVATPPPDAVSPVVVSLPSPAGGQVVPPTRTLQARVPGGSRPLPDKPSLSFAPSRPPSATSSAQAPPPQDEDAPAEPAADSGQSSSCDGAPAEPVRHQFNLVSAEEPISIETCRALTNELQHCFKRATQLYRKVGVTTSHLLI